MTLYLLDAECHGFPASPDIAQPDVIETVLTDPKQLSRGYQRSQKFEASSLCLLIDDYTLHEDLILRGPSLGFCNYIEASFYLAGHDEVSAGENFLAAYPDDGGTKQDLPAGRFLKVDVYTEARAFQKLIGEQLVDLPLEMRRVMEEKSDQCFQHEGRITLAMQAVLYQILNCPYQGAVQRLYLEGKALELMALGLKQMRDDTLNPAICLSTSQVECIYHAKDLLLECLDNPPSLIKLARQVGINHTRLNQGFRQIFGTTVFGYLYACRMEKARQLLLEDRMSVAAVANVVGYTNPAQFARAFKRRFGIAPRAYRSGEKPR
ncbi:helix-turn-helix transcriptional regulator [Pleurocapsales cyanobacterium LEGE 06147]|nr:helix-turn-helix transcriptional regulator [Pleurocapsales cyanobacterium LEGE 06147]